MDGYPSYGARLYAAQRTVEYEGRGRAVGGDHQPARAWRYRLSGILRTKKCAFLEPAPLALVSSERMLKGLIRYLQLPSEMSGFRNEDHKSP